MAIRLVWSVIAWFGGPRQGSQGLDHAPFRHRLPRRRPDDHQPLHPADPALRLRASRQAIREERTADASRHGKSLSSRRWKRD
jgi:hypothetical protein